MRAPLVPSDLFLLCIPSDPQHAPDGRVFYVLSTFDEALDETQTAIWCAHVGRCDAFTSGTHDRMPRVSPDGRHLAFVAKREERSRVYVMPTAGGEARAISPAYETIAALAWAPDGARLAYAANAAFDPAEADIAHDERSGARHIRRYPFKSDDAGLLDGTRKHVFVVPAEGADPVQVTRGNFDASDPAWSPDGERIVFAARIGAPEFSWFGDLFAVPSGGGEPVRLTNSRGPASAPAFSSDGTRIAFLGHLHGNESVGRYNAELLLVDAHGGEVRSLSEHADRSAVDAVVGDTRTLGAAQTPVWLPGDREILVCLCSEGATAIAAFAADGTPAHRIVCGGERSIGSFSLGQGGDIAFAYTSPTVPAEIALLAPSGAETRLTTANPWLAERDIRAPRRLRPQAADGWTLDLFLLDPSGAEPAPWVLQVHGGPHAAYGFSFMFEFQMLAGHGIGVAYGNPRGSQSYGHRFASAITGDWGGVDASDVLALLDAAQNAAPIDPARIGLAGGSYGGLMTTWLLGHSKRFACGISMRAVNEYLSMIGASDVGWFLEDELGAPWSADAGKRLFEISPMRAIQAIDVPLLILHSERDYRCPIDQGEQLFTLLRHLGKPDVEFVRFTGDGHNLSRSGKPRNRVLRLRAIAHWLQRYLQAAPAGDARQAGSLFAPLATESQPA